MAKHISESSPKFLPAYAAFDLLTKAADVGADPVLILERARIPYSLADLQAQAQPLSGFRFEADLLDRPTIRSYPELEALLEVFPFDVMPPDYKTVKIAHHVRNIFSNAILGGARLPRIPELARTFGLRGTTLRRRLADEGTSINEIKASCLSELAREFMTNRDMTVQQSARGIQRRLDVPACVPQMVRDGADQLSTRLELRRIRRIGRIHDHL